MQRKTTKYNFRGVSQDIVDGKHQKDLAYSAENIRFNTTSNRVSGGFSFEKGNSLKHLIPNVTIDTDDNTIALNGTVALTYSNGSEIDQQIANGDLELTSSNHVIIGHAVTRDSMILFTTDDFGMDCIWEVKNDDYSTTLLYLRNLGFSINNPIQAIFNYENENIQKVYWVDGIHQVRNINIKYNSIEGNIPLIDVELDTLSSTGSVDLSQPTVTNIINGGNHTAGVIQYAYNLFNLNSSQTKISPLSEMVALDKGALGGGEVNEVVGAIPVVEINDIDLSYTHIRVYAVKYTSFNEVPSVSLIEEREVDADGSITVFDDGSIISSLSLEEFLFLGSDPIIPKHIEVKDNNLFLFNIQNKEFILPDELDCRAYSFPINSITTRVYDDIETINENTESSVVVSNTYIVPEEHDAINLNYDTRRYQYNSSVEGGTGKFIQYELLQSGLGTVDDKKFFKDDEIYRLGIQFYNRLGQVSLPKWIADFKAPSGNLEGNFNYLKVELLPAFNTWLNSYPFESEDDKPVGYKIIRAQRTSSDKTIICQGSLNAMMSNTTDYVGSGHDFIDEVVKEKYRAEGVAIMPSLQRVFEDVSPMAAMEDGRKLDPHHAENTVPPSSSVPFGGSIAGFREVIKAQASNDWRSDTYQFNRIMQLHSPEVMFSTISFPGDVKLKIKGGHKSSAIYYWGREEANTTGIIEQEGKVYGKLSPQAPDVVGSNEVSLNGSVNNLLDSGIFSPCRNNNSMEYNQFYRGFKGGYVPATDTFEYNIYGTPEICERGQGLTNYNNDPSFKYYNSLVPMITDRDSSAPDDGAPAITSVNSFGAKCITLVEGSDSSTADFFQRRTLEDLYNNSNIAETNIILMGEIVLTREATYFSSIYGGNTYEDKKRTNYIEIGEYKDIISGTNEVTIESPGDTFVSHFKFLKIGKTDAEVRSNTSEQISEIVEYLVETTVDLKNRNDFSLTEWDTRFQPRYEEYHQYNTVYSQEPTLVQNTDLDYTFRRIEKFDTRIQATKTKIPNEIIDSWTDILSNEILDLDGNYGPINGVVSFRDNIYTFQDNSIALIGINPRVQTQGNDGVAIELGTGNKLHDYQYITTKSGSINKWGIVATDNAIYYLDGLNKRFNRITKGIENLSVIKGMHSYLENNLNIANLKIDNPIINLGVSIGYDQKNNDVYLTTNNNSTLCFNELLDEFTGFYSYNSPMYIFNKEKLITVEPLGKRTLYETHDGNYNTFYNQPQRSKIIFIANPEVDHECVFTNLEYKAEALINNIDQKYSWERIRVYNEFQDSDYRDLEFNNNIRRLNRKYRVIIPRNANSRDRIRNNWTFIELDAVNTNNHFYLNNDIILYYISNNIIIQ